mmetsp:Transcript_18723/g.53670  ORF Transcript_18723/g.53670 Transcript_18723/m.53670 type:complete len:536 (+) Transcript_18723:854-2461(+)
MPACATSGQKITQRQRARHLRGRLSGRLMSCRSGRDRDRRGCAAVGHVCAVGCGGGWDGGGAARGLPEALPPHHKVAETLALGAILRIRLEDGCEKLQDFFLVDALPVDLVEPVALEITAQQQVVVSWTAAHKRYLRQIRPSASVGASCHPDGDLVLVQAALVHHAVQLGHQIRQIPLCLSKRQWAGRQGHTRYRIEPKSRVPGVVDPVHVQERLDGALVGVADVADGEVLVASQPEVALVDGCQVADGRLELVVGQVDHPAVLDEHGVVPLAVVRLGPTVRVATSLERKRPGLLEFPSELLLHLCAEPVDAVVVNRVLETRMLPVGSVTVVPLHGHDGGQYVFGVVGFAEAHDVGRPGEGGRVVVGRTHTATHRHREPLQLALLYNCDEAYAVCKHIDVVYRRYGNGDFEFAWEVCLAVQGLLLDGRVGRHQLARQALTAALVQEYLVVRTRPRQHEFREFLADGLDLVVCVCGADAGCAGADDVAVDISAGGDAVHAGLGHAPHDRLEVALDDAVQLERLTGRHLERLVAVLR